MSESKEIIEIVVKEKHCQNPKRCIVCDNSDYQIKFIFDDEWSAYTYKTARFIYGGISVEKPFSGDTVDVPKIREPGILKVGAFTDDLATTEAEIKCCPSILSRNGVVPDPEDDVYDQVMKLINTLDTEKVSEEVAKAYSMLNITCNSLIGNTSGSVVRVDDVSPIEHTVGCKVRSRNLVPYPYTERDLTRYGVSFSIDESDKGIVLNGTAADHTSFCVATNTSQKLKVVKGEKYTLSCISQFQASTGYAYLQNFVNNKAIEVFSVVKGSITFTPTETGYAYIGIVAVKGATFDNEKVYVQLEKGDTATEYVPYVDPSTVTVTRCGKNLAPPNLYSGKVGGYSYAPNEDGSITISGAATTTSEHIIALALKDAGGNNLSVKLKANETYSLTVRKDGVKTPSIGTKVLNADGSTKWGFDKTSTQDRELALVYVQFTPEIGDTEHCGTYTVQLELGDTSTEYEPYTEATTHTPSVDGTVNGMKSVAPNMTLFTDTANTFIDAEYNLDINVVFSRINKLLETLLNGGA